MSVRTWESAARPAPGALLASTSRVDAWWLPAGDEATARAALRALLGRYLGVPGSDVLLRTTAAGKPCLEPVHGVDLRFSLAHSGGRALAAVRLGADVGADLERIRADVDCGAVAATVFPAAMRIAWHSVLAAGRHDAFFDAWVRFEAIAKAVGRGIADPDPLRGSERFTCRPLPAPAGFAAAVASEGAGWTLLSRTSEPAPAAAIWR
jgi:4'-phosphopantetheinyl transferase